MPLVEHSSYKPVWFLFHRHLETIIPSLTRKIKNAKYQRTRLELSDGDFIDLDWMAGEQRKKNLVIISHGLEGSSSRQYSQGMAKYFFARGWDALAWNCRSCSGELNRLLRFYHHGDTADLGFVVDEAIRLGYSGIVLIGFSMGGSFGLKYLGEKGIDIPEQLKGSVSFSVPCELASGGKVLDDGLPLYRKRFLGKLRKKLSEKAGRFPGKIDVSKLSAVQSFEDFNNLFTAPLHGFRDSHDFYQKSSCLPYLSNIRVPSLLVNAANDPLLSPECYPTAIAKKSEFLHLEIPQRGGHVGFQLLGKEENWMEVRAFEFVTSLIGH